jgi:hypothetical protein
MKKQVSRFSVVTTVFLLWTLIFNSLPTGAQGDIVSSDDISGGSSVFVFRRSRAAAQSKFAGRTTAKRNKAQKDQTRNSVQAKTGKATTTRKRAPKVDPAAIAALNKPTGKPAGKPDPKKPDTAIATAEQTSNVFAGAAETFLEQGDIEKALSFFTEATKLNPNNLAAREGLSEAYTLRANSVYNTEEHLPPFRCMNSLSSLMNETTAPMLEWVRPTTSWSRATKPSRVMKGPSVLILI